MTGPLPGSHSIHLDQMEHVEKIDETDFLSQAEIHTSESPSALLLSGGELRPGGENRYSIVARYPFLTLRGKGNLTRIETAGGSFEI